MADLKAREKKELLFKLINELESDNKKQIIELISSVINDKFDSNGNYRDEIAELYNNIFFDKISEKEIIIDAYKLDIKNVKSTIILLKSNGMFDFENMEDPEAVMEMLVSAVESKDGQNYIIPVGYDYVAIIYETDGEDDAEEFSMAVSLSLLDEFGLNMAVGISSPYFNIKDAQAAYAEAETALLAGNSIIGDSSVYRYERLGLAKIVYQMTQEQCVRFVNEVFTPETQKELENKEMLESINMFFKYNLNTSVTAREMYVHRNTVVYRIEKFNKISGYDLLDFENAALVRFALMVRRKII